MHLLRPAAMAAGAICDNRARLEAFRGNLCLQIVRPALSTGASIHFDTWGRSSYVVRMVIHCEHPCQDDSSNGAPKSAHKQSEGPRRHAYGGVLEIAHE